ncbi:MAG: error-prone DNA polymerase [Myxococcota bacterium]
MFLAVHLPAFRLERCGWDPREPTVLVATEKSAERVQAATPPAARFGIATGMTLAEARALLPTVRVEHLDPAGESEDLHALARALDRFTPAVRTLPPDTLLLELPAAALRSVRAFCGELGHLARLVHAPLPEAAAILARHLAKDRVVRADELAAALAPLPIRALPLPPAALASLLDVGIVTVGRFAALPAAALAGRWGAEVARAHAIARGSEPPAALDVPAARDETAFGVDFPDPVADLDAVLFALNGLVRDLCGALDLTGRAAVRVQLRLRLEEGEHPVAVRLGQPTRGPDRVFRLLRTRLERVQLAAPVVALSLELLESAAFRPAQPGLYDRAHAAEPLPELCARLQDTLGLDAVTVPVPVDAHRPEAAWVAVPWGTPPPAPPPEGKADPAATHEPPAPLPPRPPLLGDASPLRVAAAPSGRPRALLLDRAWIPLVATDGPERLAGEWWRDGGWKRDYWRVTLSDGRRAWIFSDEHRWWLHGWLDAGDLPAPPRVPSGAGKGVPAYAELIARSNHSFCEGASQPEEMVERAKELGLAALALTDRDGVYGSVRFHKAAKKAGLHAVHGALVTLRDPDCSAAVLVQDARGWASLCRLLSAARGVAQAPEGAWSEGDPWNPLVEKGFAALPFERLLEENEGLLVLARGEWPLATLHRLREAVGDRMYQAVSRTLAPGEEARIERLVARDVPCVATADALMHDPARKPLQDVLTCIRRRLTLAQAGRRLGPNAERALESPAKMARRFSAWPELVSRTVEVAGRCTFSMDELKYGYPREVVPEGYSAAGWLRELCRRGVRTRYGPRPPDAVVRQIEYELAVIERLDFPAYFLTVHDLVRFARERGILCQGRGSAANSAVCYVLGVTAVDPAHQQLLFERFISEERGEPPDIDVDFEHERREEVIQYVYEKYGRQRAAMVNEVICWRGRMATRDVGKAVGLSNDQVDRLAKAMDYWGELLDVARIREAGLDPSDPALELTRQLSKQIQGFPRHVSIHVGGFVISDAPLVDRAPVEPATMGGRTVIQWDKNDIDDLGFVKVDLLSLGMLTAIRKCFTFMRTFHGVHHDLATVPREDPAVYDMLCEADSTGVFQVESRAQQGMLPRLRPRKFYDLVIETAIVRPGPIQGGMVHPYLRRRSGEEEVAYVDERLRPILERTLGVPIFQEQVMAMAVAVGNFTAGEADALRRAMGAWRRQGSLGKIGEKLMAGMRENGIPDAYAEQIFKQIQGFAEYGFPESHAASFAHLVYVSSWQRCHFPAAFCAALINSQPMGFYAPRSLVADVERHGVRVRPIDVCASDWDCTLEAGPDGAEIRLGLRLVRGFGEADGKAIEAARRDGPFRDLPDLATRTGLSRKALLGLARASALDGLIGGDGFRAREAVWAVEGLWTGLFARLPREEEAVAIPAATEAEAVQQDFFATGLSVRRHPVGLVRDKLDREGVLPLSRLIETPTDTPVCVAGLVSHRQRPGTASGVVFMTLEDETGTVNVVVWPKLYERQRRVIRNEPLVCVAGVLQREGEAISVVARTFRPLRAAPPVAASSRDFR